MNRVNILDDLAALLEDELRGYTLPNKNGVLQDVQVFRQYLPQPEGSNWQDSITGSTFKNYGDDEYAANFPSVIVQLDELTDTEERSREHSTAKLTILTCVCSEDPQCQGYRDVLNIQDRLRQCLLHNRILGQRYILKMPLKANLRSDDTWPVYIGEQRLFYEAGRPIQGWEWINGGIRPNSKQFPPEL